MKSLSRRTYSVVSLCALLVCAGYSVVLGDFEETGFGARTTGMANSFIGLADDVYSVVYNPGAMGRIRDTELTASYRRLFWGLTGDESLADNFAAFTLPLSSTTKGGTIGAALWTFRAGDLYRENTVIVAYGRTLKDIINYDVYAGVSLRFLSKTYAANTYTENAVDFLSGENYGRDPVFDNGYGKTTIGVDIGAYFPFKNVYTAGIVVKNINSPDTGLAEKIILPLDVQAGVCYHGAGYNLLLDGQYVNNEINMGPAMEKYLFNTTAAVRGGFKFGSRNRANVTMGASYHFKVFRLDYSFELPLKGIEGTNGSHGMSMVVFLGQQKPVEKAVSTKVEKVKAQKVKTEKVKPIKVKAKKAEKAKKEIKIKAATVPVIAPTPKLKVQTIVKKPPKTVPPPLMTPPVKKATPTTAVTSEVPPVAYLHALTLYRSKEYVRAYDIFRSLASGSTVSAKYAALSDEDTTNITTKMSQTVQTKKADTKEALYASGLLSFFKQEYRDCAVSWRDYLSKDPYNPEIREYAARANALIELERSKRYDGYLSDDISTPPNP